MSTPPAQRQAHRNRFLVLLVLFITIGFIGLLADGRLPMHLSAQGAAPPAVPENPAPVSQADTPNPTAPPAGTATATLPPVESADSLAVIAMPDGLYTHLFAFRPTGGSGRFTRLTNAPWDDIHPTLSPDGTRLAYASRQNGYWDLFVLDLTTGEQARITDTAEYDGSPAWSPDGKWLAYESYVEDNLEVFIRTIENLAEPPIRLTTDPASDSSPDWSPAGREIAFISDRSGDADVWLARLDRVDDRFVNLTAGTGGIESHPAWSSTGDRLAWSSDQRGNPEIWVWQTDHPDDPPRLAGSGSWPAWHPQGNSLLTEVRGPNETKLVAYQVETGSLDIPLTPLAGNLQGLTWGDADVLDRVARRWDLGMQYQPANLMQPRLTLSPLAPAGRSGVVPIDDVTAPYPYLHDAADENYLALRAAVGDAAGWDVLANLEQAYLPLTEPAAPGITEEWLYTGRAFNLNPLPVQAGWMLTVRENFGGQTYWRLFVKTRYQDGSQGRPLTTSPWNLDARYQGDTTAFEAGGIPDPIPSGYWLDFTELAARFDWQRSPALRNWRTYYPAARFNQFIFPENLDWPAAMAQLYPPEALDVPTTIPTLTLTPTLTP
ncbi:MAG TPA: hypothetical protein VFF68_04010, partial [Anaerolineaceae bacterium]|nr:hypothetical protein [Anaerolineaceae bacterium]